MKILHVVNTLKTGGLENLVVDMCQRANTVFNEEFCICVLNSERTILTKKAEEAGIPLFFLKKNGMFWKFKLISNLIKSREPSRIITLNIIGSPEGLEVVSSAFPKVDIYISQIDEKLNDDKYIIPGLGDAGDRSYNTVD